MDIEGLFFDTSDYMLQKQTLGEGTFGTVYTAKNNKDNQLYACKKIKTHDGFNGHDQMLLMRESLFLHKLKHPGIVEFKGVNFQSFDDPKLLEPSIITEYIKGGSLKKILDQEKNGLASHDWTPTKKYILLLEIVNAMSYLHEQGIIHRDLKPENILTDEEFHPHICDFGLSRCFNKSLTKSDKLTMTGQIGTPIYMAPEILAGDNHYGPSVDVYSFSMIAYELVTGKVPYSELGKDITAVSLGIKVKDGYRPIIPEFVPKKMQQLISRCWSEKATERPSFKEIFNELSEDIDDFIDETVEKKDINDFIGSLKSQTKNPSDSIEENSEHRTELSELKKKLSGYTTSENLYKEISNLKNTINEMSNEIKSLKERHALEMSNKIKSLKERHELEMSNERESLNVKHALEMSNEIKSLNEKHALEIERLVFIKSSLDELGLLGYLKKNEENSFDRSFIASQSSCDIYNIIYPTDDVFGTTNDNNFFIEFVLQSEITINGFQIFSAYQNFPKCFDIYINGKSVAKVRSATELNKIKGNMTVNFEPQNCKKIKFVNIGKNWDKNNYQLHIKRIELLSPDQEYSNGVFATLVRKCENNDPHKCPVIINSSFGGFNDFYLLKQKNFFSLSGQENNIYTLSEKNAWFQVELLKGTAVLCGFRIKRTSNMPNHYKIICTDDSTKPVDSWTLLMEIDEEKNNEHGVLKTYEFKKQSPPIKFVRITMTNSDALSFYHFDLFGKYF